MQALIFSSKLQLRYSMKREIYIPDKNAGHWPRHPEQPNHQTPQSPIVSNIFVIPHPHPSIENAANSDWSMMLSSQFTEKLLSKITQKRKLAMVCPGSKLWLAYLASFVAWCASWFVGVRFWDMVMRRPFGMVGLNRIVGESEKSGKLGVCEVDLYVD
jgi:hypothetical protein